MSDFEIGYVMGLFVGEGCFTSYPLGNGQSYPFCSMRLHARDPEPLKTMQRFLGGRVYGPYRDDKRISCIWILRGPALRSALWLFFQYLRRVTNASSFSTGCTSMNSSCSIRDEKRRSCRSRSARLTIAK